MSDLLWLTEAQMRKIEPYFPLSHGVPRVDDRRIISGIIFVIQGGLRWRDAPQAYGSSKTVYNRFIRWRAMGGDGKGSGGAALMIDALPKTKALLGDKGYDADWFREALAERKIKACIAAKSNRKVHIPHDAMLYRQRHKIEIMFGRLKDWRRTHTRYDRCAHTFMSAICIAATISFWINQ